MSLHEMLRWTEKEQETNLKWEWEKISNGKSNSVRKEHSSI